MLGESKSVMHHITSQSDTSQTTETHSSEEKVTPLDFDRFIPWVCKQWSVTESVSVLRLVQGKEAKVNVKKSTSSKLKSGVVASNVLLPGKPGERASSGVNIHAHYNAKGNLVEISILKCPVEIPRKVILAFSLCISFHPMLTRLTIRRGGLNHYIIYEINKLLQHSNITYICLDDSYVPQGNYYILLKETSQLSYLSLNRCRINDEVCKKIAMCLNFGNPAANSLRVLELASNDITDIGVEYLATALRANRCLMHLNLAGNKITDNGASTLLNTLMEFCLTEDEVLGMRRRKFRFFENKLAVYKRCLGEVLQKGAVASVQQSVDRKSKKANTLISSVLEPEEIADKMAKEIVGEFTDPYFGKNIEIRDECYYAKGNLVLCSLNLAYNHLHFPSLQKLDEIVTYQIMTSQLESNSSSNGLLRVVIDGNYMPETCEEFDRIQLFLRAKCVHRTNQSKRNVSKTSVKSRSTKSVRPSSSSKRT